MVIIQLLFLTVIVVVGFGLGNLCAILYEEASLRKKLKKYYMTRKIYNSGDVWVSGTYKAYKDGWVSGKAKVYSGDYRKNS
jgi:hypothetical protein